LVECIAFFLLLLSIYSLYNYTMKKIAVYIADQQYVRLKMLAELLGVKQAELVRQFLEDGLAQREKDLHARSHMGDKQRP
jgi:Mn-dependent DtxR family transcriptional regulator